MNTETITHEQIKELYKTSPGIKNMFPSVFERKSGWYTSAPLLMYCDLDNSLFYGFDFKGTWYYKNSTKADLVETISYSQPASGSEILQALTKEAEKRGYDHVNPNYSCLCLSLSTLYQVDGGYFLDDNELWFGRSPIGNCIMKGGKWAEIIPQKEMTVAEIEKELGYKIKIIGQ